MARLLALSLAVSVVLGSPGASSSAVHASAPVAHTRGQVDLAEVAHSPPVDAPIIDPFRLPPEPWLAGNRGIEYDTSPGQTVRASASGVVVFSGQVGGDLFVTIRHSSELRTTVGFIEESLVEVGEMVAAGQPIALAGASMHFSARRGDRYIDPESLFGTVRVVVRLVAGAG